MRAAAFSALARWLATRPDLSGAERRHGALGLPGRALLAVKVAAAANPVERAGVAPPRAVAAEPMRDAIGA